MKRTITIYRRGVNWRRLPANRKILIWTDDGHRVVVRKNPIWQAYIQDGGHWWWYAKKIVAWADIPQLEEKP